MFNAEMTAVRALRSSDSKVQRFFFRSFKTSYLRSLMEQRRGRTGWSKFIPDQQRFAVVSSNATQPRSMFLS
ncbi:hypothetical protein TSA66_00820 [Noviherbaspirillum autotrophicum]|uniref:Uncharacterized protein n=1 Tax=Noviherbaspirillum autotrophicum TaxID=709839 RepID=A0A0C1YAN7_9BURK|nr:hypothetical protein TSA66_00820 [Noviherbaspirillum autotrophicum]